MSNCRALTWILTASLVCTLAGCSSNLPSSPASTATSPQNSESAAPQSSPSLIPSKPASPETHPATPSATPKSGLNYSKLAAYVKSINKLYGQNGTINVKKEANQEGMSITIGALDEKNTVVLNRNIYAQVQVTYWLRGQESRQATAILTIANSPKSNYQLQTIILHDKDGQLVSYIKQDDGTFGLPTPVDQELLPPPLNGQEPSPSGNPQSNKPGVSAAPPPVTCAPPKAVTPKAPRPGVPGNPQAVVPAAPVPGNPIAPALAVPQAPPPGIPLSPQAVPATSPKVPNPVAPKPHIKNLPQGQQTSPSPKTTPQNSKNQ